jgi:Mrp family chromosome partitioning ATPase
MASPQEEEKIATGRFKPWVSLLKRKWLVLGIILIINAIGLPIAWSLGISYYVTRAVLFVAPRFAANLTPEKELDLRGEEYVMYTLQQVRLLTNSEVLHEILQNPEIRPLWMKDGMNESDVVDNLRKLISVESSRRSPFIIVALKAKFAHGLDKTVNALIEVYLKKSQEANIYNSKLRISNLQQRQAELMHNIPEWHSRRTKISEELGVTTFQETNLNPYDDILVSNTVAYNNARRLRVEAEAKLNILEKIDKKNTKNPTPLDAQVNEQVANDVVLKSFKTKLIERRVDLMTQLLGLTAEHPTFQRTEREIAKIDNDIQKATETLSQEIRGRILEQRRAEFTQAQKVEQALSGEVQYQREQASHYTTLYNEALALNREIDRAYKQLDAINERISYLNIEANAPGFVRVDASAKEPRYPEMGGRKKPLLIVIVLSLGIALIIPILLDLLDGRIQTMGEVHKLMGFAPLAWLADRNDAKNQELARDQLLRLAYALQREYLNNKTRCYMVTSIKPQGGTTSLCLDLSFALNQLGLRSIAVECNAFKPDACYGESAQGLVQLFSSTRLPEQLAELILPAIENLPPRLPLGTSSQRYLMTQGRLPEVMDALKNSFDLVFLDSPPVLLSADTELIGSVAEGILVVIGARQLHAGELKRAMRLLERVKPSLVATILNRVEIYQGGGYLADLRQEYATGHTLLRGRMSRWLWKT